MAKTERAKQQRKGKQEEIFPFERENYLILLVGVVAIVAGYVALSQDGVDGFVPIVVAPILLVLGYCVVIPAGILYRKKEKPQPQQGVSKEA